MLPDLFTPSFDYNHVDGLGRALQRAIDPQLDGQTFRANAIGPILEFGNLAGVEGISAALTASWFDEGSRVPFFKALAGKEDQWIHIDSRSGFLGRDGLTSELKLNSFRIDAHKAALGAGFGTTAPLLIAAMGELIGNIVDHSEAEHTGLAVFSSGNGIFEFVVTDRGIGALTSLKKCTDYATLGDEGAALSAMVESGVSRFGSKVGHGNGFRPIFEKLADMTGQLRFRSGDYALLLDGRFGDKIGRQLSQKPRIAGFFAAVTCRAQNTR